MLSALRKALHRDGCEISHLTENFEKGIVSANVGTLDREANWASVSVIRRGERMQAMLAFLLSQEQCEGAGRLPLVGR